MKKIVLILFLIPLFCSAQPNGYYFFDDDDIQNIRTAAQTVWGQHILSSLKNQVEQRRNYSLRVPLLEAGHGHDYCCPIHNVGFTFEWDSPYRHYCALCGRHWENVNRYDWAWVNLVHNANLKYLIASMYLFIATTDTVYAGYIRDMMLDYASKYPTYFVHDISRRTPGVNSGRMFGQSLNESVWASDAARAYLVAKPVMTAQEIKKIETGYLEICAQMLLNRRVGGNWQAWHNSGLTALGIALQNDSIIRIALEDSICGYHKLKSSLVYDDGWWVEGTPYYHFFPLRAMLLTADAVRCRGINLFDGKLYNMLVAPALSVYSNLIFPAHNDGGGGESLVQWTHLYEIACKRYNDSFLANVLKTCYMFTERFAVEALQNGVEMPFGAEVLPLKSICFENLGVAILRSDDKAVVLKYGPHGGAHGHPDKLSISMFSGKEELLADLGSSAYGAPDHTKWYRKTVSHSTVTVDGKDQEAAKGQLVSFKPSGKGGIVEAKADNTYTGVEMKRSLNLHGNYLTDIFSCTSLSSHTYDYVLILTQKPELPGKSELMDFSGLAGYERITGAEIRKVKRQITFRIEGAEISIQLLSGNEFEVITGEAPGIGVPPLRDPSLKVEYVEKPVYPLLIRVKDKNMKIKTEWKIK